MNLFEAIEQLLDETRVHFSRADTEIETEYFEGKINGILEVLDMLIEHDHLISDEEI